MGHGDEKDKPFKAAFQWFPAGNVRLPMTSPPGGGRVRLWGRQGGATTLHFPIRVVLSVAFILGLSLR